MNFNSIAKQMFRKTLKFNESMKGEKIGSFETHRNR